VFLTKEQSAPKTGAQPERKFASGSTAERGEANMASIKLTDLALSEALDREAMRSIRGADGEGDWVLSAFPYYSAPASVPSGVQVFNYWQQITNNYTYIGKMVNQVTTVDIANSGANSTNNAVLLTSLSNSK
jgi:hypothetical protein